MDFQDMKITPEERDLLEWCCASLDEEQRAECEYEAMEVAAKEINAPEAAELLTCLYVRIMIRNFREEIEGGGNETKPPDCPAEVPVAPPTTSRTARPKRRRSV